MELIRFQEGLQAQISELAALHFQGEENQEALQASAERDAAVRQQQLHLSHEAEQRAMAEAQHRQQQEVREQEIGLERAALERDEALKQEASRVQQEQYLQQQAQA